MTGLPWFLFFFVVMPVGAYREWGGWLGVLLLGAIYVVGIVATRAIFAGLRR